MEPLRLYIFSFLFLTLLSLSSGLPVKFQDESAPQESGRSLHSEEEGRIFHGHAMKKRKKKKLLHCLLNLQRNNPQVDARTLFFNYVNLEYTQHGGGGGYHDDAAGSGGHNCLSQLGGGGEGGDYGSDSPGLGGIGEGINNLGSLVGQAPGNIISSVGDGIKPVFENPERYLNRYIIRPLYRSLRPFYRLF